MCIKHEPVYYLLTSPINKSDKIWEFVSCDMYIYTTFTFLVLICKVTQINVGVTNKIFASEM